MAHPILNDRMVAQHPGQCGMGDLTGLTADRSRESGSAMQTGVDERLVSNGHYAVARSCERLRVEQRLRGLLTSVLSH